MKTLTAADLAEKIRQGIPIRILDVRRLQARSTSGVQISGADWRNPADWLDWKDSIAQDLPIVLYCAHGKEISQGLTAVLQAMGADATYLEGGIAQWQLEGHPVSGLTKVGEA